MTLDKIDKQILHDLRNGKISHLTGRVYKATPRDEVMKKVEDRMAKKKRRSTQSD